MNGRDLTLGVVGALAVAGALASRRTGSRALSSITATSVQRPSQPWKGIVGAAKGGPSQEKWRTAYRNYPLEIDLQVVDGNDLESFCSTVRRPAPGSIKLIVSATTFTKHPEVAEEIETSRKQDPSNSVALMTPFAVMHRVFDESYGLALYCKHVCVLTEALADLTNKYNTYPTRIMLADRFAQEDGSLLKWLSASSVYRKFGSIKLSKVCIDEDNNEAWEAFLPYAETDEAPDYVFSRVVASLTCPTAAGRMIRITTFGQAMADCYATWAIANRNPLVKLTEEDLRNFRVDKQINRWLKSIGGKKNTTDVAIRRYRENLERVAVPVLRWVNDNIPDAIETAAATGQMLHDQRKPLIDACNDVLSIQRVLVI